MNPDNFIVRLQLGAVEHFRQRNTWDKLTEDDRETLQRDVAGLPSQIETDGIEARLFDLTALRMQLASANADMGAFENGRKRVVEISMLLEEKASIPAVSIQREYLASLQESSFWEGIDLATLENMRLRLRGLVQFLDKKKRKIVYTDFKDEVLGVRPEEVIHMLKMTGAQYEKKVEKYLSSHLDDIVIHRLRTNKPLSAADLESLESTLVEIGEDDGKSLLTELLARSETPSLAHFVRSMVGMDRAAAQEAFSQFLSDHSLNTAQIRFIETIIDQLTSRGVMDASALYEPPFTLLHDGGPNELFAGKGAVINALFKTLRSLEPHVHGLAS
jgi:type I restriction enzyme R subunit